MATLGRPEVFHAGNLFEITEKGLTLHHRLDGLDLESAEPREATKSDILTFFERHTSGIPALEPKTRAQSRGWFTTVLQERGYPLTKSVLESLLKGGYIQDRKSTEDVYVDETFRSRVWKPRGRDIFEELSAKYMGTQFGELLEAYWKWSNQETVSPREVARVRQILVSKWGPRSFWAPGGSKDTDAMVALDSLMSYIHETGYPAFTGWEYEDNMFPEVSHTDTMRFVDLLEEMSR